MLLKKISISSNCSDIWDECCSKIVLQFELQYKGFYSNMSVLVIIYRICVAVRLYWENLSCMRLELRGIELRGTWVAWDLSCVKLELRWTGVAGDDVTLSLCCIHPAPCIKSSQDKITRIHLPMTYCLGY